MLIERGDAIEATIKAAVKKCGVAVTERFHALPVAFAPEADIAVRIVPLEGQVAISAVNGPTNTVIAGRAEAVRQVLAELEQAGVATHILSERYAFHSPLLDPMLDAFERAARGVP